MINNIYIDASYDIETNSVGIGIYNSSTKYEYALVSTAIDIVDAETLALKACVKMCLKANTVSSTRIFTDSQIVHRKYFHYIKHLGFIDFIWIPRELNSDADRLSKLHRKYIKKQNTSIKLKGNTLTATTKIKEIQPIKTLTKKQIITALLSYPQPARLALLEKLSVVSKINKNIHSVLILDTPSPYKKTTYFYLTLLLLPEKFGNSEFNNHLSLINEQGLEETLAHLTKKD